MKNKFIRKVLRSKKGFTLAELLIVIGIIAVLAAIAIPTFSSSMKKANIAVDQANVRAWYAEKVVAYMVDGTPLPTSYDGPGLKVDGATVAVDGTSAEDFTVTYTAGTGTDTITFTFGENS